MRFIRGLVGLAPVLVFAAGCANNAPSADTKPAAASTGSAASTQSPVERGKYLVYVAGCNDCHTPKKLGPNGPEADMDRQLSGNPASDKLAKIPKGLIAPDKYGAVITNNLTAWAGAWGVSFAMNLTPDKATGLGSWTPEMFVAAIRTGKHQGTGRPILPPMPWNWYKNMTDDDLKAVFAYLQSLPPINNPIPDPLPPDKMP